MSRVRALRKDKRAGWLLGGIVFVAVAILPLFRDPLDGLTNDVILALAFVVMALGLNLVVGFAGLLDLGFVAFYAFGLMVTGWWASDFFSSVNNEEGIHIGVGEFVPEPSRHPPQLPAAHHRGDRDLRDRRRDHRPAHAASAG